MALLVRFYLQERLRRRRRTLVAAHLTRGLGFRVLGHGAYSTAFALGRSKVLKVTDAGDDTALWFGHWIRRFPNLHWPRIQRQVPVSRSYVATWMERLYPLDSASKERVSFVDDFVINAGQDTAAHLEGLAEFGYGGRWQGCPKRLRQPLLDCRRAAELRGFLPDAKREVFMRRPGGMLVLVDPFVPSRARRCRRRANSVSDAAVG